MASRPHDVVVDPADPLVVHRALGAVLGSAVADALGAPFEFGSAGEYRRRFPEPVVGGVGEMVGGGSFRWAPGQFTDDTEMAVATVESLLACEGFDADDQLERFRAWAAEANDVGSLTSEVLASGLPVGDAAASVVTRRGGRGTAGNGSLMRAAPGAVFFASRGRAATMAAGQELSAVTHTDPLAQWAVALQHEMVRVALAGDDPLAALPELLPALPADVRAVYEPLLSPTWTPGGPPTNGSAMGALAQAVWAVRHCRSFEEAVTAVIDLGDDTDSAGAVTGTLAGAIHGLGAIPSRWTTYVHGFVTDPSGQQHRYDHLDLQALTRRLLGGSVAADVADEPVLGPVTIVPGLYAANRAAVRSIGDEYAVVSLCRIDEPMRRPVRREVYLVDQEGHANPALELVLDDVLTSIDAFRAGDKPVVVHCHGGRSRTGFVLMAWLMREFGTGIDEAERRLRAAWPELDTWNQSFREALDRRSAG